MIYRTYRAPTYKEAVINAKMDLGSDVYILGRKEVRDGGFLGLFSKTFTEITVARNEEKGSSAGKGAAGIPPSPPTASPAKSPAVPRVTPGGRPGGGESPREMLSQLKRVQAGESPAADRKGDTREEENMSSEELLAEIRDIKTQLKRVIGEKRLGPGGEGIREEGALDEVLRVLREKDFSDKYIEGVRGKLESELTLQDVQKPLMLRKALQDHILEGFDTAGPLKLGNGSPRVVVLVGPTGVGKTTTVAKLAASFGVLQKKSVELVTIDSYRIAAIEQLNKYAELMQIPFTAVSSRDEFREAVKNSKAELILVDTVGRSQWNSMGLAELRSILDGVKSDMDIHLVISATTKYRDAVDITTRFDQLMYGKVIISKLDETNSIGSILSVLNPEKKVSYLTNGQGVPDDIEIAQKEKILDLLEITGVSQEDA